jgi:hypothetical protein
MSSLESSTNAGSKQGDFLNAVSPAEFDFPPSGKMNKAQLFVLSRGKLARDHY